MDLTGGIITYTATNPGLERLNSDAPPHGRKVVFINKNGFSSDRDFARLFMSEGQILTVHDILVGRTSSSVTFVEIPGKWFKPDMFMDIGGSDE